MKKYASFLFVFLSYCAVSVAQYPSMNKLLYGVAYYDEYMPYDRLDKDVQMMKEAGINVVRIAESTWGTVEPHDGIYDFSHIDRVLTAMGKAGIGVIIGTPTYALPTWLVKKHPGILAITANGQNQYGERQNMDITNKDFRFYAERVIRKIMEHVKDNPAVIGYQVDNETKPYNTAGPNVQQLFVQYVQQKFKSLDTLNKAFGLDYWSNRINSWEDFPSTVGNVNASMAAEFAKFQREIVTNYLAWQAAIVNEYKRKGQFITHNFDLGWRGYSYGVQPEVDHFAAARALDIAGIDIYHPSQDQLTGIEISFGGDMARSMKQGRNYLVIETEAQGFPNWVPYPGQLRLQAFSHLASGANMVSYWHWHSIHNSVETYWKGLLSHDFATNPTYEEAKTTGKEFNRLSEHLVNLKKKNNVAILFSNEAQTAFNLFRFGPGSHSNYDDIVRPLYDALYKINVGCDFVNASHSNNFENYQLLIVPGLYAAPDSLLQRLNTFVKNGGHIIYTYKSGFSDANVKVRTTTQPGIINEACGIGYNQFTIPQNVSLKDDPFKVGDAENKVLNWMELITPSTAKVLAYYNHPVWGKYAAVTENVYGKGLATYIGCMTSNVMVEKIVADAVKKSGLWGPDQQLRFPLITKSGTNMSNKIVHYYFNYSASASTFTYPHNEGKELFSGDAIQKDKIISIEPWGVKIIEEAK